MTPFQTMVAYLSLGASPLAAVMIVMADIEGWAAQVIGLFILAGLAGTTYLRIRDDERAGGMSSRGGVESRHARKPARPVPEGQPCEGYKLGVPYPPVEILEAGVAPGPREAKHKKAKK